MAGRLGRPRAIGHPLTNADWWATVKTPGQAKARPPRPSGRVWTMHHGTHKAALEMRLIEGLGAEIVLSIDNELRRARFYRRTQVLEMLDVIASAESRLTTKGWRSEASRP